MCASGFFMTDEAGKVMSVSVGGGADLIKSHVRGSKEEDKAGKPDDKGTEDPEKKDGKDAPLDDEGKECDEGEGKKLPDAVGSAVDALGGSDWSHGEGKSKHPLRLNGGGHMAAMDTLGDAGWAQVHGNDHTDVMTHPDGHVAVFDRDGLTINHAKAGKGKQD